MSEKALLERQQCERGMVVLDQQDGENGHHTEKGLHPLSGCLTCIAPATLEFLSDMKAPDAAE